MPRNTRLVCSALVALASCLLASTASAAPPTPSFQGLAIEPLSGYVGQTTCDPTEKPGASALRSVVLTSYPGTGDFGIARDCAGSAVSEHKEGRAWDWRVNAFDPAQDAAAQNMFAWLLAADAQGNPYALARRLGIMYIIYNGSSWSAYNASAGWRPYTGASPHTDHVHFSLSWPGAWQQTSYWTALAGQNGSSTPMTSTDAITGRWHLLGGAKGPLGLSMGSEYAVRGGRAQNFQGGRILWSLSTGAHAVWGSIGQRYDALGGPAGPLGLPTGDEQDVHGGRASSFQGGRILWSLSTGAHAVWGSIGQRYDALGGPAGPLGLPTGDEQDVHGGRASSFQGGRILWSLSTGAHAVWGSIASRYAALGGPAGPLGLPTSDEQDAGPGGRVSVFSGGRIYWSLAGGARVVSGPVLANHEAAGGSRGPLGLPTSDLVETTGPVSLQMFAGGWVYQRADQARHVRGVILERFLALGGPAGSLGAPVTDEYAVPAGRRSDFQGGQLTWTAATGQVTGP